MLFLKKIYNEKPILEYTVLIWSLSRVGVCLLLVRIWWKYTKQQNVKKICTMSSSHKYYLRAAVTNNRYQQKNIIAYEYQPYKNCNKHIFKLRKKICQNFLIQECKM